MTIDLEKLPAIRNLSDDVRQKALEFAGALGARGPRPTTVLGTAVTLAQEWKSGRLPVKQGGPAVLVQPRNGRWIIRRADSEHATHTFLVREDAVRRAQDLARRYGAACLVFGPGGTLIERYGAPGAAAPAAVTPVVAPEPVAVAEPQIMEVVAAAEVAPTSPAVEPVAEAAIVAEPEPVLAAAPPVLEAVEVAPVPEPEPVVEAVVAAPVSEPDPEPEPAIAIADLEVEPIRVKRAGAKWLVVSADGRTESFTTKQKAMKRGKDLAAALGCPVVLA